MKTLIEIKIADNGYGIIEPGATTIKRLDKKYIDHLKDPIRFPNVFDEIMRDVIKADVPEIVRHCVLEGVSLLVDDNFKAKNSPLNRIASMIAGQAILGVAIITPKGII